MQNHFTTSMLSAIITSLHTVNSPELFSQIWTYTTRGVCILEARLSSLFSNLVYLINTCYDKGLKLHITHEVPLKYTARFAWVNVSESFPTPASACSSHLDCLEDSLKSTTLAHITPALHLSLTSPLPSVFMNSHSVCLFACFTYSNVFQFQPCCRTISISLDLLAK